jgi:hypothetical protein
MCIKGIHFASISTFFLLDFGIALTPDGVVFSHFCIYYFTSKDFFFKLPA